MKLGRWLAIGERYESRPFVTPFEDDDFFIGPRVFEELGDKLRFDVEEAPPGSGVLPSLDLLAGDTFTPLKAHELVQTLYEHTTTMRFLDRSIEYRGLGRALHWLYRTFVSRGMQQLVVPAVDDLPDVIDAKVLFLDVDRDEVPDYRVWVRTFENGGVFYVGTVATHRDRRPTVERAYLTVCLPLYRANVAFVFQPFCVEGGGLALRTRGSRGSDAGVYLVFPGRARFSLLRVPTLSDEIRIEVATDHLSVTQRHRFVGGGFDMLYAIRPKSGP